MNCANICLRCKAKKSRVRGLCTACYEWSLDQVRRGRTTWDQLIQSKKALPVKPASNHWLSKKKKVAEQRDRIPQCDHGKEDGECPICEQEQRSKVVVEDDDFANVRRELHMHLYRCPEGFNRARLR